MSSVQDVKLAELARIQRAIGYYQIGFWTEEELREEFRDIEREMLFRIQDEVLSSTQIQH